MKKLIPLLQVVFIICVLSSLGACASNQSTAPVYSRTANGTTVIDVYEEPEYPFYGYGGFYYEGVNMEAYHGGGGHGGGGHGR